MRIIFMGTPEFAVPSLEILIKNKLNVVAVVTATDKKAGRGNQLITTPVKDFATHQQIPALQPENLKAPEFIEELKSYQADLQVIVAFRMLPQVVWDMPAYGSVNLHASLLPQYRGAAPINWAIINGETETGVSTFLLQHEIDTGHIIFQEKEPIYPEDTAGTLYERLKIKGANLVLKTVQAIKDDNYPQIPQDLSTEIKKAPKIFREDCEINWQNKAAYIHNFVRGLAPIPAAWISLLGKNCKIYKTQVLYRAGMLAAMIYDDTTEIGKYRTDNKSYLAFRASDAFVLVEELQLEGKKRMDIRSFLAGNKL